MELNIDEKKALEILVTNVLENEEYINMEGYIHLCRPSDLFSEFPSRERLETVFAGLVQKGMVAVKEIRVVGATRVPFYYVTSKGRAAV